jgi:hypothetical protein
MTPRLRVGGQEATQDTAGTGRIDRFARRWRYGEPSLRLDSDIVDTSFANKNFTELSGGL